MCVFLCPWIKPGRNCEFSGNSFCDPELLSERNTVRPHVREVMKNSLRKLMHALRKRMRVNIGSSFYAIIVEFLRLKPTFSGKRPTN